MAVSLKIIASLIMQITVHCVVVSLANQDVACSSTYPYRDNQLNSIFVWKYLISNCGLFLATIVTANSALWVKSIYLVAKTLAACHMLQILRVLFLPSMWYTMDVFNFYCCFEICAIFSGFCKICLVSKYYIVFCFFLVSECVVVFYCVPANPLLEKSTLICQYTTKHMVHFKKKKKKKEYNTVKQNKLYCNPKSMPWISKQRVLQKKYLKTTTDGGYIHNISHAWLALS